MGWGRDLFFLVYAPGVTNQLKQALDALAHVNTSSPHAVTFYRDRLSEIAEAASDAGLDTDGARAALRSAMNSQTPAPFPDDMQREALARLTGMLDYIRWKATQVD